MRAQKRNEVGVQGYQDVGRPICNAERIVVTTQDGVELHLTELVKIHGDRVHVSANGRKLVIEEAHGGGFILRIEGRSF